MHVKACVRVFASVCVCVTETLNHVTATLYLPLPTAHNL